MKILLLSLVFVATIGLHANAQKKTQWADGVPVHTDWKSAIKEARETGKLLFIYNGWQNKGI